MKVSLSQLLLVAGAAAAPAALESRAKISDYDILNYALTLEHLEATFYTEALKKFDADDFKKAGYEPAVHFNLMEVKSDEDTHVTTLTGAIKKAGGTPVAACKYDFGLTDVDTFMKIASILEGVGVTAYLGAAQYVSNPTYLTVAGSILTVEARHNAFIRANQLHPESPFAQPFDVPQDFDQVYSLASAFITSCPKSNPPLPVKAFPSVAVAPGQKMPVRAGHTIMLETEMALKGDVYGAFLTVLGPVFEKAKVVGKKVEVRIPAGVAGQSYVVLTHSDKEVTDANTLAGPGIISIQAPYTYGGYPGGM